MFFWQPLVLPPSVKDSLLDFGVRSATHTSSIIFVVVNSNPIEVRSLASHAEMRLTELNTSDFILWFFFKLLLYRAFHLLPNMSIVQSISILNLLTCGYFCYNTWLHCNTILPANTICSGGGFDYAEKEQFAAKNILTCLSLSAVLSMRQFKNVAMVEKRAENQKQVILF